MAIFRVLILAFFTLAAALVSGQPLDKSIDLSYVNPGQYEIGELTVSGVEHLDPQVIISLSQLRIGDNISIPGPEISNAIKRIWKEKLVGDISISITNITGNVITLDFKLEEQKRINHPYFYGVKKSDENDLKEKLGLVRSKVWSDPLRVKIERTIQKFYWEKGYPFVSVNPVPVADTANEDFVNIKVFVDKGEKVKINSVTIKGNSSLTDKEIKKKLKKTKEKKWWRFFGRSKYIAAETKGDLETIIAMYNGKGMRDARIIGDPKIIYPVGKDSSVIDIEIEITEGQVYHFGDIAWSGNFIYDDKYLSNILDIKKGDIFDKVKLDSRLNFNPSGPDISSLYLDDGYLFFSVNPVERSVDGSVIDLEMRVFEGQQATINRVIVTGNTKTSDHVILREIRTLPGEKFSRSDLIRTQREIAALGYFDPEQIGIIPIPNPQDGTVDIEYKVVEKPSDQLQLSGGWGGAVRFVGTLGLVFNNFSLRNLTKFKEWSPLPAGDGQRLQIRAQSNGPRFQSYTFSFTEPWLGGKKPNSFTLSLNHSRQGTFAGDGHLKVSGATVSLGKRLKWPDDFFTSIKSVGFNQYNVHNFGTFTDDFCDSCRANKLSYTATISRNNIGVNPQYPTTGASISLSVQATPPYTWLNPDRVNQTAEERQQWIEYHKWMFDYNRYIKLTGNKKPLGSVLSTEKSTQRPLVLNTRAHLGFIGAYNGEVGVGPFDRFILGGSGITGFNFLLGTDIIGLRGYQDNALDPGGGGGVAFSKFVTELRYPLVTEGMATIFVLGFLEAGNTWGTFDEFDPFKLKKSAGIGARIFMPAFGMIGVDYGYGFDQVEGKVGANKGQFHFSIGQMLR